MDVNGQLHFLATLPPGKWPAVDHTPSVAERKKVVAKLIQIYMFYFNHFRT